MAGGKRLVVRQEVVVQVQEDVLVYVIYILNVPGIYSARRLDPKIKGDVSIDIYLWGYSTVTSLDTYTTIEEDFHYDDVPIWYGGT